jgi:ParB family transcriptional regulator, chromosome partitioning protein
VTTELQPDSHKTLESTTLPPPEPDLSIAERNDFCLAENDLKSSETTSDNVITPEVKDVSPPLRTTAMLQLLDPTKICIGSTPNRNPKAYEDEAFESLCQSMAAQGGNTQPIQVRLLTPDEIFKNPGCTHMLISGERRKRAAAENVQLVLAIVFEGAVNSDVQVMALTENLNREDLCPFELGRLLKHMAEKNVGYSLSKLALLAGKDKSVVSRAIELASLPTQIVEAFTSGRDLRYSDAKPLREAFEQAPENVLTEAALIKDQGEKLKGPAVVKRLVEAASGGVAPCNTPEPIMIKFEERVVGELTSTKSGGSQIAVELWLTDQQRKALVAQIESFVTRKVLRTGTPEPDKPKSKRLAKAQPPASTQPRLPTAPADAERGEA